MNSLLVRVGADSSAGGGFWNGPVDPVSNRFVYVSIPETKAVHKGMEKPYIALEPILSKFGVSLPHHLREQHMHLDPDFSFLTYGDQGQRASQLSALDQGDSLVFYAGLAIPGTRSHLVYAIIGIFVIDEVIRAGEVSASDRAINAHTRRILAPGAQDLIVRARPRVSGRLERCVPIGERRDRAYRVQRDLLTAWGGLSVNDGYLQRSARFPKFLNPGLFQNWLESKRPTLQQINN